MGLDNMTAEQRAQARAENDRITALRHDIDGLYAEFGPKCMPKREKQIKTRLRETPLSQRIRYLKATRGKSLASAVRAHCFECVGGDRVAVEGCTDLACALYPYRPGAAKLQG